MDDNHIHTSLDYSSYASPPYDPHRCGNAPFSPTIEADGTQNSCASYANGFDKDGCNKYLPNYPDDDFIFDHLEKGGSCDDLKDCKRKLDVDVDRNAGCFPTTNEYNEFSVCNSKNATNTIEQFGMYFDSPLNIVLWIVFLCIIAILFFDIKF